MIQAYIVVILSKVLAFISAIGLGICDVADFQHHSRYEEPQLSKKNKCLTEARQPPYS